MEQVMGNVQRRVLLEC